MKSLRFNKLLALSTVLLVLGQVGCISTDCSKPGQGIFSQDQHAFRVCLPLPGKRLCRQPDEYAGPVNHAAEVCKAAAASSNSGLSTPPDYSNSSWNESVQTQVEYIEPESIERITEVASPVVSSQTDLEFLKELTTRKDAQSAVIQANPQVAKSNAEAVYTRTQSRNGTVKLNQVTVPEVVIKSGMAGLGFETDGMLMSRHPVRFGTPNPFVVGPNESATIQNVAKTKYPAFQKMDWPQDDMQKSNERLKNSARDVAVKNRHFEESTYNQIRVAPITEDVNTANIFETQIAVPEVATQMVETSNEQTESPAKYYNQPESKLEAQSVMADVDLSSDFVGFEEIPRRTDVAVNVEVSNEKEAEANHVAVTSAELPKVETFEVPQVVVAKPKKNEEETVADDSNIESKADVASAVEIAKKTDVSEFVETAKPVEMTSAGPSVDTQLAANEEPQAEEQTKTELNQQQLAPKDLPALLKPKTDVDANDYQLVEMEAEEIIKSEPKSKVTTFEANMDLSNEPFEVAVPKKQVEPKVETKIVKTEQAAVKEPLAIVEQPVELVEQPVEIVVRNDEPQPTEVKVTMSKQPFEVSQKAFELVAKPSTQPFVARQATPAEMSHEPEPVQSVLVSTEPKRFTRNLQGPFIASEEIIKVEQKVEPTPLNQAPEIEVENAEKLEETVEQELQSDEYFGRMQLIRARRQEAEQEIVQGELETVAPATKLPEVKVDLQEVKTEAIQDSVVLRATTPERSHIAPLPTSSFQQASLATTTVRAKTAAGEFRFAPLPEQTLESIDSVGEYELRSMPMLEVPVLRAVPVNNEQSAQKSRLRIRFLPSDYNNMHLKGDSEFEPIQYFPGNEFEDIRGLTRRPEREYYR